MSGWNTAQQIYIALGVHSLKLCLTKSGRSPSYTKKGPGRTRDIVKRKDKKRELPWSMT